MATLTARFPGACRGCDNPIVPGDLIVFVRKGKSYHVDCTGTKDIVTTYFPSTGNTVYRNAKGRCIDSPCCGCCSD